MEKPNRIGTTGHAILGLLAVEPGTAYQLTRRMTRNYRYVWPRAQSKLFVEVKKLVAAGLASAHPGTTGKRPHVTYKITAAGRRALERWVPTESAEPSQEFEALLKITYGDFAGPEQLLSQLHAIEQHARAMRAVGRSIAQSLLDGEPWRRAQLQSLVWRWLWDHYGAMARWAAWAQDEVRTWRDTGESAAKTKRALVILAEAIRSP